MNLKSAYRSNQVTKSSAIEISTYASDDSGHAKIFS